MGHIITEKTGVSRRKFCIPRAAEGCAIAKTGTRTQDLRITNALLYQLSYLGVALTIPKRSEIGNPRFHPFIKEAGTRPIMRVEPAAP